MVRWHRGELPDVAHKLLRLGKSQMSTGKLQGVGRVVRAGAFCERR